MGDSCGAATRCSARVVRSRGPESLKLGVNYGTKGKRKGKRNRHCTALASDRRRRSNARQQDPAQEGTRRVAVGRGKGARVTLCCLLVSVASCQRCKKTLVKGGVCLVFRSVLLKARWWTRPGKAGMRCCAEKKRTRTKNARACFCKRRQHRCGTRRAETGVEKSGLNSLAVIFFLAVQQGQGRLVVVHKSASQRML